MILILPSNRCHIFLIFVIYFKCKLNMLICFRIAHETLYHLFKAIKLEECSNHIMDSINCLDTTVDVIMHKLGPCIIKYDLDLLKTNLILLIIHFLI